MDTERFEVVNRWCCILGLAWLGLLLLLFATGCATRQPSSTDHHSYVPPVDCGMVHMNNQVVEKCCQQDTCWFVE